MATKTKKKNTDDHIMVGEHRCEICNCKDYEHAWWEGWDAVVEEPESDDELSEAKEAIARRKPLTKKDPKILYDIVTDRIKGTTGTVLIKGVCYHRNGIGGEGFKVIHFKNEDGRDLLGIVTYAHDEAGEIDLQQTRMNIKVINPMDIEDCYRGADHYGEILLQVSEDRGFDKY